MVAMADRNGTDVVLGRVEGVNRNAPRSMWGETLERTDVFSSNIKFTLSAQKLFRREFLERHGMRFDESLWTGEDALFTMEAYLRADGVSVVADYTCYYLVGRDDGKHVTKTGSYTLRFDSARALMGLLADWSRPAPRRDVLMVRPFLVTVLPQFGPELPQDDEEVRRTKLELAKPLMDAYWNGGVAQRLLVHERLRLELVADGRAGPPRGRPGVHPGQEPAGGGAEEARHASSIWPTRTSTAPPRPASPTRLYLAEPREAREVPGYREVGVDQLLRRAVRKARRVLTPTA